MKPFFLAFSLVLLAIFVAYFVWLVRPSQHQQKPSQTYESYQTTEGVIQLPPKEEASNKTTEKYTEREIEEWAASRSDLAAQWNMADTAFIGLCVGGLGLLFIAGTLVETRKASELAKDGANAAWKAVQIQEEIGVKQIRAYIGVTSVHLAFKEGGGKIRVNAYIKNSGQSPALNKTDVMQIILTKKALPDDYVHPFKYNGLTQISSLGAGETNVHHVYFDEVITKDEIKLMMEQGYHIYFFGKIVYSDVFGNKRETITSFYINHTLAVDSGADFIPTQRGHTFT